MHRTGGSWALKGLGLVGLLMPEAAWATCVTVTASQSLEDAFSTASTGAAELIGGTLYISQTTELCIDEGWSDPSGLACIELTPGKNLTITANEISDTSTTTPIELPGLFLPSTGSASKVKISDATFVGQCASEVATGVNGRLVVDGSHNVTLTDVSLTSGDLYGLFAAAGTLTVSFTDPRMVFAEDFLGDPAVKLYGTTVSYTQTGGEFLNIRDASALKSEGATVALNDVTFTGNGGASVTGGALHLQNGYVTISGGSFDTNEASDGGAIWADSLEMLNLDAVTFKNNSASGDGGAVDANAASYLVVQNGTTFTDDHANYGGAINSTNTTANFTIFLVEEALFTKTVASVAGGAIHVDGGLALIGKDKSPSFVSTSAPVGGAIVFANPGGVSTAAGASFEDIQGGYAIDISSPTGNTVKLSGLTSPNGLGQYGLLRVHSLGRAMLSDSTITGVDSTGSATALAKDTRLIEVNDGGLDISNSTLCGFIADESVTSLVDLELVRGSVAISESTFMNLDGLDEAEGLLRINGFESIYLYNNTFVGALEGPQSAIDAEGSLSLIVFNNIFHQLASGLLIVDGINLSETNNLYPDSVETPVLHPSGSVLADTSSIEEGEPGFVSGFDPTRCSVWPYLTEDSQAVDAGRTLFDGAKDVGDPTRLGAWDVLTAGDDAAVDADDDKHTIVDDCDDADAAVSPSAPEVPKNKIDDDCDGYRDEVIGAIGVDMGDEDTGGDTGGDSGDVDSGADTDLEVRLDQDGDGVPDDDDCAPDDATLAEDCPGRFTYSGGRPSCATAPPAALASWGLLVVALAATRRRRPQRLV